MVKLVWIGAGGALGSMLRYGLSGWTQQLSQSAFPHGTWVVNVVGCLVIGLVSGILAGPHIMRDEYRLLLMIGLLGGFTTFSTFGLETFSLLNEKQYAAATAYVLINNVAGIAAVWIGYRGAEKLFGV